MSAFDALQVACSCITCLGVCLIILYLIMRVIDGS